MRLCDDALRAGAGVPVGRSILSELGEGIGWQSAAFGTWRWTPGWVNCCITRRLQALRPGFFPGMAVTTTSSPASIASVKCCRTTAASGPTRSLQA